MKYFLFALVLLVVGNKLFPSCDKNLQQREQRYFFSEPREYLLGALRGSGYIVLLGGLRAPLAICLWMKVEHCWEDHRWMEMNRWIELILELQPYKISYYTMAAWELAWNASNGTHDQAESRFYIDRGRRFLEQGIMNNPENSLLYEHLGVLLRDRLQDHEAAAAAFQKGATLPGAHSYLRRFVVYELAASGNHNVEAYQELEKLYHEAESQRVPALLALKEQLRSLIYTHHESK